MGWNNPPVPWRDLERTLSWGGAKVFDPDDVPAQQGVPDPRRRVRISNLPAGSTVVPYAELHCHSHFSFLDGVSDPAALVKQALQLGLPALAITDHDGFYGAVRFATSAKGTALKTIYGSELSLGLTAGQTGIADPEGEHLLVLARTPEGYRRLSAAIGAAQLAGGEKGKPVYDLQALGSAAHGQWAVLTGCRKGAVPAALIRHGVNDTGMQEAEAQLRRLVEIFGPDAVHVELVDHDQPMDDDRNDALAQLADKLGLPTVATNNVHYAHPVDYQVATALAALRARRTLDEMDGWLPAAGAMHLRSGAEMAARFERFPGILQRTTELGLQCAFDLDLVSPQLPDFPVPQGHTEATWLRELARAGAIERYGSPQHDPKAHRQIESELNVITELNYPGYFLIVHNIVQFCRNQNILCQGRGSAANSAVCYALGITNVDSVEYNLLFERFLSVERGSPPDIDLDIESRRREEVIQYVYEQYGRDYAAQVANVICYRPRMALRDAARVLGYSMGTVDAWARQLGPHDPLPTGPDPDDVIPEHVTALARRLEKLPRHLGIHSGGMVICDRPVAEVCPTEWARMENRSVLQWDKDSCADADVTKIDLLGLGMLGCLHDTFDLITEFHGTQLTLATIPREDPAVYQMLCAADSIGVFQVESRAQMATLPRLRPEKFYDLVVEVAIIRPGPIQGGAVHPYLRRKNHNEKPLAPHEVLQPVLERTLGVPLFQEQVMQMAIVAADFTPTEADLLRRAISAKRSDEKMFELRERLMTGMARKGIPADIAEDIYAKLHAFSGFGFPESHAISFAWLVYVSSFVKRYYPAAFCVGLLRNQPMGFYSSASLIADARRHGVQVHRIDVNISQAQATLEPVPEDCPVEPATPHRFASHIPQPAIRLGMGDVRSLGQNAAEEVAAEREKNGRYDGLEDFVRRTGLSTAALEALATAGAFAGFGYNRREALWAVGALARTDAGQLPGTTPGVAPPPLQEMSPIEQTFADLWAGNSTPDSHPIEHVRADLDADGVIPLRQLETLPDRRLVRIAGIVTHRQRPPTAGGVCFLNLEDETGMANVICPPQVWERQKRTALGHAALIVIGTLEHSDGAINVLAGRIQPLRAATTDRSRNFR